jgi:glycerol-3-phosphate dehydrogenase
MKTRKAILKHINDKPEVSVLIIGAGINGVGTFRDLALQGVNVLLVDKGDFCSGVSMASSHMLHGGIRYLENGEFRLVREALHERNRLLRNAPHLAKPLPTTMPIFKTFSGIFNAPMKFLGLLSKPAERGALVIKIGLLLYDLFVRGESPMPQHSFISRKKMLQQWPALNPDIQFAATYYDGAMPSPERLCVEIACDAEKGGDHANAANYLSVVGAKDGLVQLRDELTGDRYLVAPRVVVNAAGPWIDLANHRLGQETNWVGGTKGSHVVLDHIELRSAIGDSEFFFEYVDGRIVLIFPFGDKVIIGTTDIRIDHPDDATCTDDEIDYILNMVPHVFPDIEVSRENIIFHFSGVRPLPPSDTNLTGQISRDHSIKIAEPDGERPYPILSLVGGKWTTYRAFSEQTTDKVLAKLGIARQDSTANIPIGGGQNYPPTEQEQNDWIQKCAADFMISIPYAQILFERYGTGARDILTFAGEENNPALISNPSYTRREIAYLIQNEKAVHLDDVLLRRSLIAWMGEVSDALLIEIAGIAAEVLGWSSKHRQDEIERTRKLLIKMHGVRI